jgi:hypothetical protein
MNDELKERLANALVPNRGFSPPEVDGIGMINAILSELATAGYAVVHEERALACNMWPVYNEGGCTKDELLRAILTAAEQEQER